MLKIVKKTELKKVETFVEKGEINYKAQIE
jgi:hypothetical protein